jgi:ATPase subunit of ABC transporter with duplicated ATPase domains
MTDAAKQNGPREFLDLEVKEVSMVDLPANLRKFLIVKRREEPMSAFQQDYSGVDASQIGITPQTESGSKDLGEALTAVAEYVAKAKKPMDEETYKALSPELKAAMKMVMGFMAKMMTGQESTQKAVKSAEEDEAAMKERHATEKAAAKKEGKSEEEMKALEDKQKQEEEEAKKAKKGEEKAVDKEDKVQKSVTPPEQPAVAVMSDGSVVVRGVAVEKAKGFTADRMGIMKQVTESLLKLLGEVDETAVKSLVDSLQMGELPSHASVASQVRPEPASAPVQKSQDGQSEVVGMLQDVVKRLDKIEAARSPSTSVEGDGPSETKKTKTEKSFWGNVI